MKQPKGQQGGNQWHPPRGIRYSHRPDRPAPFFLHWRDANGKRFAASYRNEATREKAAKALAEKRGEHGSDVLTFEPRDWRRWLSFRELVGDVDPLQVAQEWLAGREKQSLQATILAADASARYLIARESEGIAKATLCHARKDMGRFVEKFGSRFIADIKSDEIRAWLATLPFSEVTRRNHFKRVKAFWKWARLEGLAGANPCEGIKSPARESDDVSVLSVAEVQQLFATAERLRPQVCAKLALEAFAGLRFSSAARLIKEDVDFTENGITEATFERATSFIVLQNHFN